MIRMVEMSVLLGIKSRGTGKQAQKKGRAAARPLQPGAWDQARGWSLDQIPQPRKGLGTPINGHFDDGLGFASAAYAAAASPGGSRAEAGNAGARLRSSSYGAGFAAMGLAEPKLHQQRRLEARPGFEPGSRAMQGMPGMPRRQPQISRVWPYLI
jgi:hypothetical protein